MCLINLISSRVRQFELRHRHRTPAVDHRWRQFERGGYGAAGTYRRPHELPDARAHPAQAANTTGQPSQRLGTDVGEATEVLNALTDFGGLPEADRKPHHTRQSTPLCENLLGFLNLVLRPGEAELHFSGSARDDNFDRGQTAPLHTQVKLFMGFVKPVVLETVHGSASAARQLKAMTNIGEGLQPSGGSADADDGKGDSRLPVRRLVRDRESRVLPDAAPRGLEWQERASERSLRDASSDMLH